MFYYCFHFLQIYQCNNCVCLIILLGVDVALVVRWQLNVSLAILFSLMLSFSVRFDNACMQSIESIFYYFSLVVHTLIKPHAYACLVRPVNGVLNIAATFDRTVSAQQVI